MSFYVYTPNGDLVGKLGEVELLMVSRNTDFHTEFDPIKQALVSKADRLIGLNGIQNIEGEFWGLILGFTGVKLYNKEKGIRYIGFCTDIFLIYSNQIE